MINLLVGFHFNYNIIVYLKLILINLLKFKYFKIIISKAFLFKGKRESK